MAVTFLVLLDRSSSTPAFVGVSQRQIATNSAGRAPIEQDVLAAQLALRVGSLAPFPHRVHIFRLNSWDSSSKSASKLRTT